MHCVLVCAFAISLCFPLMIALKLQQHQRVAILSSFTNAVRNAALSDKIYALLTNSDRKKLVYIPTASYAPSSLSAKGIGEQRRRARYDARQKMELIRSTLSLKASAMLELDAAGTSKQNIASQLLDADVLYVDGGNTFYLQRHMIESGFWEAALPALRRGCLYIGASAGGIVAGRSIETAYWKGWDDPQAAGEGYVWNEDRLRGANLCEDASFFMHFLPEAHSELVKQKSETWAKHRPVACIGEDEVRWYGVSTDSGVSSAMDESIETVVGVDTSLRMNL